jgi:methylated-DNA-[protein]-cysteine S-methyltransferase
MKIEQPLYEMITTAFGPMGIVWRNTPAGPRILQTVIEKGRGPAEGVIRKAYPNAHRLGSPAISELGDRMKRFLRGEVIAFDLELVAWEMCGLFQQKVLLAEYGIPRGWVSTYGRIANRVGSAKASRAVGRALATNPFPILIPCHRAVQADGAIGGYQGGPDMKRALLEMEGVEFTVAGKVFLQKVFY